MPVYFPTVGQYLDIESLKNSLSGGNYTQLMAATSAASVWALDLIDAVSHLQVLCPTLGKELSFGSYLDVPLQKAAQLTAVYKEQFLPWYWPQLRELLADAKLLPPTPTPAAAGRSTSAGSSEPDPTDLDQFNDQGTSLPEAGSNQAELEKAMAQQPASTGPVSLY